MSWLELVPVTQYLKSAANYSKCNYSHTFIIFINRRLIDRLQYSTTLINEKCVKKGVLLAFQNAKKNLNEILSNSIC